MRTIRSTGSRCGTCAAAWDDATARYCGRCGQPLRGGSDDGGPAATGLRGWAVRARRHDRRAGAVHRTRLVLIVLGLSAAFVAVGLLVGGGASRIEDGSAGPETAVELPGRDVVQTSDRAAGSTDIEDLAEGANGAPARLGDPITCRPDGCERWRADLGPGTAHPVGDQVIHVGANGLTAVAVDDGTVLWSEQVEGAAQRAQLVRVVGDPSLVVAVGASTIESREPATGEVRWRVSLPGRAYLAATDSDTMLVYGESLEVRHSNTGRTTSGPGFIASLDDRTGEPRWLRRDVDLIDLDPSSPLVRLAGDELAALDPITGEPQWRRADALAPGAPWVAQGDAWMAVASEDEVAVLDRFTGDVERRVALQTGAGGWLRIIDRMLLVGHPPAASLDHGTAASHQLRHDITVLNLDDHAAPGRSYTDVVDIHPFGAGAELIGSDAASGEPAGLVLAVLDPDGLELHRLDVSGQPLWQGYIVRQEPPRSSAGPCCWSLEEDRVADRFLAMPPGGGSEPVRIVSESGVVVARFDRPQGLIDGPERWHGRVVVGSGRDDEPSLVVAGPWATADVATAGDVVLMDPVVLVTETGLLAIETEFLAGPR